MMEFEKIKIAYEDSKTIQARMFFITIAQSVLQEHTEIESLLVQNEQYLSAYLIAREAHTDGSFHFHIYLKYSKTKDFSFSHFDYLGQHPNIQKVKSVVDCISYILKEDSQPLYNKPFAVFAIKKSIISFVSLLISQGKDFYDIITDYPESITVSLTKLKNLCYEFQIAQRHKKQISKKPLQIPSFIPEPFKPIISFIEQINKFGNKRPLKTKNLLLYSKQPNKGKTTLLNFIAKHYPSFSFPTDGWFDGYKNNFYHLIKWNEVSFIGYKITDLLLHLEGDEVNLSIKGSKVFKDDNPLIIMTSNKSLPQLLFEKYRDQEKVDFYLPLFEARMDQINCDDINLFDLIDLLNASTSSKNTSSQQNN